MASITYRALWRWHFHAGLFCIPFVIVLALTGHDPGFQVGDSFALELDS